jgi:peptidoglycan/LPS O-acetylase OafA/YrhL
VTFRSITLGRVLGECAGRPSAFDYMRVVLACSIVVWHTVKINYGNELELQIWNGPARPLLGIILPMFFSLSGFLVAGSYERCKNFVSFLYLRVIRILPALVVETIISALILGPLFTSLPLVDYVSDGQFRQYFLNMIGDVHYFLPGVFGNNPSPRTVNGQLWTVPYELKCYILVALFSVFGVVRRTWILCTAFLALQIFMLQRGSVYGDVSAAVPGNVLVLCFLAGFILYRIKNVIPFSLGLFFAAVGLHLILYFIKFGDYCIAIPDAYITIYLGLLNPPRSIVITKGDFSYGIYLYGFVIQQSVAALGPWTHDWRISLVISFPIILATAILSWQLLERIFLRMKNLTSVIDGLVPSTGYSVALLSAYSTKKT